MMLIPTLEIKMIKLNNVPSEFRPLESYKMLIGGEWVSSTSQKNNENL